MIICRMNKKTLHTLLSFCSTGAAIGAVIGLSDSTPDGEFGLSGSAEMCPDGDIGLSDSEELTPDG